MERNLSEGHVLRTLLRFALPFIASNMVQSFYNVADMLIVGWFAGPNSMSGVNIGGQITFILTNIIIGLCMGATALIGQYMGAGNRKALEKVTSTIITLLVVGAAVITALMLVLKRPMLLLMQTPTESYFESDRYLTVTVIGLVFIFGYNALSAILRGMGDSKHPFYFVLTACVTNIALDFLFVAGFHWASFGAALATIISQAISMFLCISFMIRNRFHFDFKFRSFAIDRAQCKLIFKIGLPTAVQNGVTSLSFLFLTAIVNIVGGVNASAGVGAVGKFNSFAFMPAAAISASVSTMSAQNIGAGRMDRAIKSCWQGCLLAAVITYAFFALVQLFPDQIVALFSDDRNVIEAGALYLKSFSFDFLLIPFIFCLNSFLIGGGHSVFSLFTGMLSAVLLRVPVCYLIGVTLGQGLYGVGWGAPAASTGALIAIAIFMLSGRWKHNAIQAADPPEDLEARLETDT
jgi:putative MATE family efflux protein